MKKIIMGLWITLSVISCSRGEYYMEDIVGGRTAADSKEAREYMLYIGRDLVGDMLDELVLAQSISERGVSQSAHFAFDKPLDTIGATWTVKADDSQLQGLSIHCEAVNTWNLTFEGYYFFGDEMNFFPTRVNMKASRYVSVTEAETADGWDIVLSGQRKEWNEDQKNGQRKEADSYSCTFGTADGGSLRYLNTRGAEAQGWNKVYGDLYMTVFKGSTQVDMCCLSFEGSLSQATFIRGL